MQFLAFRCRNALIAASDWLVFNYFRCCFQFVLSLSLAILALYSVSASDVLVLVPLTLPLFLILSAFDTALISSVCRR